MIIPPNAHRVNRVTTDNRWNSGQIAASRQNGALAALKGELRRNQLLCNYNKSLQGLSTAPFIHFPTVTAIHVTFEERHSYPKLAAVQDKLEHYVLGIIQVNELIDLYHSTMPAVGQSGYHQLKGDRDGLKNKIAAICDGSQKLEGLTTDNAIALPALIEELSSIVEGFDG